MATDRSRHLLPLRETCNRCRELKVRCRGSCADLVTSTESAHGAVRGGSSCLRCLRAGAVCTFGPKQRSGRPRAIRGNSSAKALSLGMRTPSSRRQASSVSSSASSSLSAASPPSNPSSDQNLVESFSWALSPPDLLCEPLSNSLDLDDLVGLLDRRHSSPAEADPRRDHPSPVLDAMSDAVTTSLVQPPSAHICQSPRTATADLLRYEPQQQEKQRQAQRPPPLKLSGDAEDVVTDTSELMGLNLRIYQLQVQVGIAPPTLGHCDDMASITRTFLGILERMVESSRTVTSQPISKPLPTPSCSSAGHPRHQTEDLQSSLRRHSINQSIYVDDRESVCDVVDAGTFLLIVACYQRLIDLFKHVCLSIHAHMEEDSVESQSSTAQVAMTTELISHLLGRLDRGLQRLTRIGRRTLSTSTLSPCLSPLIMPPGLLSDGTRSSMPNTWSTADSGCSVSYDDLFSNNTHINSQSVPVVERSHPRSYLSCFPGVGSVIDAMARRQAALHAHIGIIKHVIQESDKF